MRLLLDTCTVIWAAQESRRLSFDVRELLESGGNSRFVSCVSLWEIAVKNRRGHLQLAEPLGRLTDLLVDNLGVEYLALSAPHCLAVRELPDHHRDPFDRMLICQALVENLVLVTPDPVIAQYAVRTIW
jgi:PIN domain nuclease of toxin-antitoxin system